MSELNEQYEENTFLTNRGLDFPSSEKLLPLQKIKFSLPPEAIMMRLDKLVLKKLHRIWRENPDGLEVQEFMKLISEQVHTASHSEKMELLYGCINMFNDVDINGDGSMEWNEFV